jgi:Big-like domain-containing protein
MMKIGYGRGRRHLALAFIALAGLLAFAPQVSAQPFRPSETTVEASLAAPTTGEQVVLTATVTCPGFTPGGLGVAFADGPNLLGDYVQLDANGRATITTTFAAAGPHEITAAYSGDNNCSASFDTTTVTVANAPTPPTPGTPCCGGLIIGNGNNAVRVS